MQVLVRADVDLANGARQGRAQTGCRLAIDSSSAMRPRTSTAAKSCGLPALAYTTVPRVPPGAEGRENEWVMQSGVPLPISIPARPGRLI